MNMFAGFGMGQSYALDSVGTFFQAELTRLDPELHKPLVSVTWSRDLPLRSDVSVGDEFSAFLRMKMGSVGGLRSDGINWVGTESTALPAATVDNERIVYPLRLWGSVVEYTVQEVERSQRLGRPIDVQKIESMHQHYQASRYLAPLPYSDAITPIDAPYTNIHPTHTPHTTATRSQNSPTVATTSSLKQQEKKPRPQTLETNSKTAPLLQHSPSTSLIALYLYSLIRIIFLYSASTLPLFTFLLSLPFPLSIILL